jgi:hypothetical protein
MKVRRAATVDVSCDYLRAIATYLYWLLLRHVHRCAHSGFINVSTDVLIDPRPTVNSARWLIIPSSSCVW